MTPEQQAVTAQALSEDLLDLTLRQLEPNDLYLSTGVMAHVGAAAALAIAGGMDGRAALALITCTAESAIADMEAGR